MRVACYAILPSQTRLHAVSVVRLGGEKYRKPINHLPGIFVQQLALVFYSAENPLQTIKFIYLLRTIENYFQSVTDSETLHAARFTR